MTSSCRRVIPLTRLFLLTNLLVILAGCERDPILPTPELPSGPFSSTLYGYPVIGEWDKQVQPLHSVQRADGSFVSVGQWGDEVAFGQTPPGVLYATVLNPDDTITRLWATELGFYGRSIDSQPDGSIILRGAEKWQPTNDNHMVVASFNHYGVLEWKIVFRQNADMIRARALPTGGAVIVGTTSSNLHVIDHYGVITAVLTVGMDVDGDWYSPRDVIPIAGGYAVVLESLHAEMLLAINDVGEERWRVVWEEYPHAVEFMSPTAMGGVALVRSAQPADEDRTTVLEEYTANGILLSHHVLEPNVDPRGLCALRDGRTGLIGYSSNEGYLCRALQLGGGEEDFWPWTLNTSEHGWLFPTVIGMGVTDTGQLMSVGYLTDWPRDALVTFMVVAPDEPVED